MGTSQQHPGDETQTVSAESQGDLDVFVCSDLNSLLETFLEDDVSVCVRVAGVGTGGFT